MKSRFVALLPLLLAAPPGEAQIRRDPNGVNVNASGATTVFITFGGLSGQVPAEAFWCGALVPAAPDLGFKCDPLTIFGRLPLRYDQSRLAGPVFNDVMSIPPSVSRRAYQAAVLGEPSSFFYVRRFVRPAGGPDEHVFVTCRLAGGGARVPFSLLDVRLAFASGETVLALDAGKTPPAFGAAISYSGTGRLKGRWEVVLPGSELPTVRDLLTEATLPPAERPLQRRYTEIQRFNVFLPPTGSYVLPGPDSSRLPTSAAGLYWVLLRIEASDDKEADSILERTGAGTGVVHAGAVAGFPMPVLRYHVGAEVIESAQGRLVPLLPADGARLAAGSRIEFAWSEGLVASLVRVEVVDESGSAVLQALVQPGTGAYVAPPWLPERAARVRWRVVALGPIENVLDEGPWRTLELAR